MRRKRARAGAQWKEWAVLFAFVVFAIVALGVGVHTVFHNLEPNLCKMTYMFPNYVKIHMDNDSVYSYKYALYLYREGPSEKWEAPDGGVPVLRGIPVLFIPGNAGSYKQVRSLAGEAAKKAKRFIQEHTGVSRTVEFDFFSIDFHEELSAFIGEVLLAQAEFAADCISRILSLYAAHSNVSLRPTSVLLIGHSMGGVVARAIFTLPQFSPQSVHTIITLNSPHRTVPVLLHRSMASFYHSVNALWGNAASYATGGVLHNVAIASIAGSFRDSLIRSGLTRIDGDGVGAPSSHALTVLTTTIPGVGVSTDHECILWCNQLVRVLVDTLYDLVDKTTALPYTDQLQRMAVLRNRLVSPVPGRLGLLPAEPPAWSALSETLRAEHTNPPEDELSGELWRRHGEHDGRMTPSDSLAFSRDNSKGVDLPVFDHHIPIAAPPPTPPTLWGITNPALVPRDVDISTAMSTSTRSVAVRFGSPDVRRAYYLPIAGDRSQDQFALVTDAFAEHFAVLLATPRMAAIVNATVLVEVPTHATRTAGDDKVAKAIVVLSPADMRGYDWVIVVLSEAAVSPPSNQRVGTFLFAEVSSAKQTHRVVRPPLTPLFSRTIRLAGTTHPLLLNMSIAHHDNHLPLEMRVFCRPARGAASPSTPAFAPVAFYFSRPMREGGFAVWTCGGPAVVLRFHEASYGSSEPAKPATSFSLNQQEAHRLLGIAPPPRGDEDVFVVVATDPSVDVDIVLDYAVAAAVGQLFSSYVAFVVSMSTAVLFAAMARQARRWRDAGKYPRLLRAVRHDVATWGWVVAVPLPVAGYFLELLGLDYASLLDVLFGRILPSYFACHSLCQMALPLRYHPPLWVLSACYACGVAVVVVLSISVSGLMAAVRGLLRLVVRAPANGVQAEPPSPPLGTKKLHPIGRPSPPMAAASDRLSSRALSRDTVLLVAGVVAVATVHSSAALVLAIAYLLCYSTYDSLSVNGGTSSDASSVQHYHHTVLVVGVVAAVLCAVPTVVWLKNLPYEKAPSRGTSFDDYGLFAMTLLLHVAMARHGMFVRGNAVPTVLTCSAIAVVCYCLFPLYRLVPLLHVVLAAHVVYHLPLYSRKFKAT